MKFTSKIKAEEFAISESIKRWNTYFQVHEHDDGMYTVGRYYEENSISYAIKGKLTPHMVQDGARDNLVKVEVGGGNSLAPLKPIKIKLKWEI